MKPLRTPVIKRSAGVLVPGLIVLILQTGLASGTGSGVFSRPPGPDKYVTNSVGMRLVPTPAGKFMMGSPDTEPGREPHEGPLHEVEITKPFDMGAHEVTVGQFRKFVEATGFKTGAEKDGGAYAHLPDGKWKKAPQYAWRNPGFGQTDEHPVVCVNFNDVEAFCKWLTAQEGRNYRLPTEAEWEYCCRAGTATRWSCGGDESCLRGSANLADESIKEKWPRYDYDRGKMPWNDGFPFTAPVGKFKPNAWGLYDMHGNAWEWCSDWYAMEYYKSSPRKDPKGAAGPDDNRGARVLRGGGWAYDARHSRSARRNGLCPPAFRFNTLGFRVVRER